MASIIVERRMNVNIVMNVASLPTSEREPFACLPDSGRENVRAYLRDLAGPSVEP